MSTPNPLIPQGSFQAQAGKGASNVRIAVATIVAIHVVFFGGLLLQGCKPTKTANNSATETNSTAGSTNLSLPPIPSDSLYYSNATHLPTDAAVSGQSGAQPAASTALDTLAPSTNAARDFWKSTNLTGNATTAAPMDSMGAGALKEYTVVRGDTFKKIAVANGTTVGALRKANPNVDPSKLKIGMKLEVPTGTTAASTSGNSSPATGSGTPDATGVAPSGDSYIVKAGDTLTKVAKTHGITVSQLRAANNLKTSGLKVGQKLKIPAPSAAGTNELPAVKHRGSRNNTNTTGSAAH